MELGTQIRKYRNERTLSQEALAEKVYVSRQTVSTGRMTKVICRACHLDRHSGSRKLCGDACRTGEEKV